MIRLVHNSKEAAPFFGTASLQETKYRNITSYGAA